MCLAVINPAFSSAKRITRLLYWLGKDLAFRQINIQKSMNDPCYYYLICVLRLAVKDTPKPESNQPRIKLILLNIKRLGGFIARFPLKAYINRRPSGRGETNTARAPGERRPSGFHNCSLKVPAAICFSISKEPFSWSERGFRRLTYKSRYPKKWFALYRYLQTT